MMSDAIRALWRDPIYRERCRAGAVAREARPHMRGLRREWNLKQQANPKRKARLIRFNQTRVRSPEERRAVAAKARERLRDPKYKQILANAALLALKAANREPNGLETRLGILLRTLFGSAYVYVGGGRLRLGGKCPDFVCRRKKLLVEAFGDYWHRNHTPEAVADRIAHFARFGYGTLIIWEREMRDLPTLRRKLLDFHGGH